jgi:hypothetical protein
MPCHFRPAIVGLVLLLGSTGFAAAQSTAVELTPEQRTTIYRSVVKEKVRTPPPAGTHASVGAELPASIELYTLPDAVADVPAAKQYKYTVVDDQVVLVDPTSMKVVEVLRQ